MLYVHVHTSYIRHNIDINTCTQTYTCGSKMIRSVTHYTYSHFHCSAWLLPDKPPGPLVTTEFSKHVHFPPAIFHRLHLYLADSRLVHACTFITLSNTVNYHCQLAHRHLKMNSSRPPLHPLGFSRQFLQLSCLATNFMTGQSQRQWVGSCHGVQDFQQLKWSRQKLLIIHWHLCRVCQYSIIR